MVCLISAGGKVHMHRIRIVKRGQTKMRYELWPPFELPTRRHLGDGALLIGTEEKRRERGGISLTTIVSFPLCYLLVPEGGSRSELVSLLLIIALSFYA